LTRSVVRAPTSALFAQVVQQVWQNVGVAVRIEKLAPLTLINRASQHDFQAMLIRWAGRPDPDHNVYQFFHSESPRNYSLFRNDQMDRLLMQGRTTTDPGKRAGIYHRVSQLLAEKVPYLFLVSFTNYFLAAENVR